MVTQRFSHDTIKNGYLADPGEPHVKGTGMIVGKFELDRRQANLGVAQALVTLAKLMVGRTCPGKKLYLIMIAVYTTNSEMARNYISLHATLKDTLMATNISHTIRDTKLRN